MKPDQFRVSEHFSYDMLRELVYVAINPTIDSDNTDRMFYFLECVVTPIRCEMRLFPDYQFNADEFAKR